MLLVLVFALGYLTIILENTLKINKAAPALLSACCAGRCTSSASQTKRRWRSNWTDIKKGLAQGISPRASPFVGYTIKPLRIPAKP